MANRISVNVTKVAHLKGHKDSIYNFIIDKEEGKIYSVGSDGYVVEWDINGSIDGKLILKTNEALYSIWKQGKVLKVGSQSGVIYTFNKETCELISKEKKHRGGVFFIDNKVSGGEDGVLVLSNGKKVQISNKSLRCITKTNAGYLIGASDHLIYDVEYEGKVLNTLIGHTNSVFGVTLLDKNTLVSTGRDALIKAWDLTIKKEVHSVAAHMYQATSLSSNNHFILSSSMDKTIKVWSHQLELLKVIDYERNQGHTNCVNKVAWVDENMCVSCSDDRSLILWQIEINS